MWMVLCSKADVAALWAYQGLKRRGLSPLVLVTAEVLANSLRWEHRVGPRGADIEIELYDGRRISKRETRGTLNRLQGVPYEQALQIRESDRMYAAQEFTAFFMSWLNALPSPILNRPTVQGLSGQWRHISEWICLASKAGLPVPGYCMTSREPADEIHNLGRLVHAGAPVITVIVVAGRAICAHAPAHILQASAEVAKLAETELLGLEFIVDSQGSWIFAGATPAPDLRSGGEELLDALFCALKEGRPGDS